MIDNTVALYDPIGTGKYYTYMANLNRINYGTVLKAGFQYMPVPKLSLGFTVEQPFSIGGEGKIHRTSTKLGSGGLPVDVTGKFDNDMETLDATSLSRIPTNPSASLGLAYFFTRQFLISSQWDMYAADTTYPDFPVAPVWNAALGTEYYFTEVLAMRLGVFTNNSKTRLIDSSHTNQQPHLDMMGYSLGLSMYRSGSSLSFTGSYVGGKGEGQAFQNSKTVQQVTESTLTIYLSGSYQL